MALSIPYSIKKWNSGRVNTRLILNESENKGVFLKNRVRIDILRILFHVTKISCKDEKYSLIKQIIYSQNQIKN